MTIAAPGIIALWLGLLVPQTPQFGDLLAPGLHPSATLLAAWSEVSGQVLVLERRELGQRALWLEEELPVDAAAIARLRSALESAAIRVETLHAPGDRKVLHVRHDGSLLRPARHVVVWSVRHGAAEEIVAALNASVAQRERELPHRQLPTHFQAHGTSGQVIVRYSDADRVEQYRELFHLLDTPRRATSAPTLQSWRGRGLTVDQLGPLAAAAWLKRGHGDLHWVAQRSTNTLLIEVVSKQWPELEKLLQELDPPPR